MLERADTIEAESATGEWLDEAEAASQDLGAWPQTADELFGERIRRLRERRNLTLRMLAATIGATPAAISRWENGKARPRAAYVKSLARALGVALPELLGSSRPGWAAKVPRNAPSRALPEVIAECRELIARAAGTDPGRVRILIEV